MCLAASHTVPPVLGMKSNVIKTGLKTKIQ